MDTKEKKLRGKDPYDAKAAWFAASGLPQKIPDVKSLLYKLPLVESLMQENPDAEMTNFIMTTEKFMGALTYSRAQSGWGTNNTCLI